MSGKVTNSANGHPVAGAEVRIGDATTTTGADGRFELTDLPTGQAVLHCTAPVFVDFVADISVTSGSVTRDIGLARIEVFEFGDYALYVPAAVDTTRGLLIALGGPDTRGYSTGKPLGAPSEEVETSLQALGAAYREMAADQRIAVLGTSLAGMTDGSESDQAILAAVQTAAGLSGHAELPAVPMLVYGMSTGGPQAAGFVARNADRVAGLFLKVPLGVTALTTGSSLQVPTYVVLAELDAFVDNAALTSAFQANRAAGALWALAKEPAVPHIFLTAAQREVTVSWMNTILGLRLGATASDPLRTVADDSGWLGDLATGNAEAWADYPGERAAASWLPSEAVAAQWGVFIGLVPGDLDPGPIPGQARFRVVHTEARAPTLDAIVDGSRMLTAIPYLSASDYLTIDAGLHTIELVGASGSSDLRTDFAEGASYTDLPCFSCYSGWVNGVLLIDDRSEPAAGKVRLRIVNFVTDLSARVYVTAPGADLAPATPVATLPFTYYSAYVEVPAGDYQIRITSSDSGTVLVDSGTLTLRAGQVRTAVAANAPGGGAPFSFLLLADRH